MTEDAAVSKTAEIGNRLRRYRERLALTQSQLSDRVGMGTSSISEFESGKREPTVSQLKRLATALSTDVVELLAAGEAPALTVRWRERPSDAPSIEARFIKLCRQYRRLEQWAQEEEPVQLRRFDRCPSTTREAQLAASRVRQEMGLGDRPGLVLRKKLEDDWALKAFHLALEPSGTAACIWDGEFGAAVLLNARSSVARRTFDLAHELFHLMTWGLTVPAASQGEEEKLANRFAAALLLPDEALREAVERRLRDGRISIANMCELAREFGVSLEALLWRMHNVFRWTDPDKTRALIEYAYTLLPAYQDFTPDKEEEAAELPERYRSLAVQTLRSGEISTGRFAEYMGVSRWQAMKHAKEALGDDAIALPGV